MTIYVPLCVGSCVEYCECIMTWNVLTAVHYTDIALIVCGFVQHCTSADNQDHYDTSPLGEKTFYNLLKLFYSL